MQAVSDEIYRILSRLSELGFMKEYYLAGGTNLALRYNHRTSIDLDFFTYSDFDIEKNNLLNQKLIEVFGKSEDAKVTNVGLFTFLDDIKVDFVIYPHKLIEDLDVIDNTQFASIKDIAAMKLNAIIGRGSRKDFFDLHYLLKKLSLSEMIESYSKKYQVDNFTRLFMSLTYFDDAHDLTMRNNLYEAVDHQADWQTIQNDIVQETRKYIAKNL